MSARRAKPPGRPRESFPPLVRRMPVEAWPAPDRSAWEAACRPAGLLDEAGAANLLASQTRAKRAGEWGRFLSYLDWSRQLDPAESPARRLTPERVGGYIRSLRARLRDSSVWCQINDLSYTAPLLAPGHDWSWIRRHQALPSTREVRAARKPIEPPDPNRLLYGALQYCRQAEAEAPSVTTAIRFRDGLIIAFATWSALRRKNLAEMEIGRHLRIGDGVMRIVFEQTVKNGETIDWIVPDLLRPYVETYLEQYRPLLLRGGEGTARLWINRFGKPLAYEALRPLFEQMGIRLTGKPMTVHGTRYAYATAVLTLDPRDAPIVSGGLAHRGTGSVNKFYDRSGTDGVSRAWLKALRRRRRFG